MNEPPSGRAPKSTNWSSFFDGAYAGRNPGHWPTLLQRAWQARAGEPTQPLPLGPDNYQNKGSRGSQYSS